MWKALGLALFLVLGMAWGQGPSLEGTLPPLAELSGREGRPPLERLLLGPLPEGYYGFSLSARLLLWSVPWSFAGALGGILSEDPKGRSFWLANALWTSVNSAVALVGLLSPEPSRAELRDILYLNAALDVLYIAGGLWLATRSDPRLQGAGWAVVLQGGFLLVFDLYHALTLGQ
ncbi:MAG: hypothetical protein NZ849_11170 [Meiothermus sp.]|uniref:DUF6992 family protein n=1 Tax=Meiothermus sp. TaxID=1955249 RepID=UPI0025F59567|nr:hypothetical protein [Meiothermus sp.]MCS7058403.1 hypothetical protein [Meiothermus sp.]MCS7195451.1 hypothetical protein [Meiothermus sp.]MCX7740919.1 hypothetical protein [Meiothermus sp.]MDW8089809.1 hypothetical protein [Meiothermus sp.]MDW8481766.1 hypothetical protein [Meiothermus sp.]